MSEGVFEKAGTLMGACSKSSAGMPAKDPNDSLGDH